MQSLNDYCFEPEIDVSKLLFAIWRFFLDAVDGLIWHERFLHKCENVNKKLEG